MAHFLDKLYALYHGHPVICTDSRSVEAGSLFFALHGDRFDGNKFAAAAIEAGAVVAVVDDPEVVNDERYILVSDTLQALQDLARHHRRQFHIPLIAITGSNGKTTTKELLAAVLGTTYSVHFTKGNFNNHIGLPLTLLSMPEGTEAAIIEMGANHQGEIESLCRIAEPTHGLITNIGKAHLEGFGGLEGVKKGKSELYRYLAQSDGVAFVNAREPFLQELSSTVKRRVIYGSLEKERSTYTAECLATQPFVEVSFKDDQDKTYRVESNLTGSYNFPNLLTAISLGKYFKVAGPQIVKAMEDYTPRNNRSEVRKVGSNTIILDAYNANPSSMKVALANLKSYPIATKVAILGDMLELGDEGMQEHQAIAELASGLGLTQVILVGPLFAETSTKETVKLSNVEQAKAWLGSNAIFDAVILIKGSRGLRMEDILKGSPLAGDSLKE